MFYARIAIATCMEAADPRDGETCPLFNAKLRLFENASAPTPPAEHPDDLTLATINSQHVPVANTTEQAIAVGDEIMVGETIDERWVVINGGAVAPRIQFVTVAGMSGQQVAVKVLRVHGAAPDLSGGVLQFGSNINVTDPFNLWAEVELDATGWAYYVAASTDDTETTEVTEPTHPARYEIEECSLPIKELEGTITSCLLKTEGTKDVTINLQGGDIRSSYPCVDSPPEISGSGVIPANNTYHLDAILGSKVTIRRTSDHKPSTPEDYALGSGSASSHSWEIIRVEKKIARWIRTVFQSGTWQYGGEGHDGFSPFGAGCEAQIIADPVECLPKSPTIGYAFYMPESHRYRVVSTKSALLGAPGKHSFIKGAESPGQDPLTTNICGLAVRPQLEYYSKEIFGWGEEETEGCTGGGLTETEHNVDMGFGSSQALTNLSLVCGASCVWTYTNGAWVGDCSNPGCYNCATESPLPQFPVEGQTVSGVCSNALGESGLCFSAAYFLYCGPSTGPTPVPGPHCIPTTDCPEEEEESTGDP